MPFKSSGTVEDQGSGIERRVAIFRKDTLAKLAEASSDPSTGAFEITHDYGGECLAVCEGDVDTLGQRWRVHGPFIPIEIGTTYFEAVSRLAPVAYWTMGDVQAGFIQDLSGNDRHAELFGTYSAGSGPLVSGGDDSIDFGGGRAEVAYGSWIPGGANAMTAEAWLHPDNTASEHTFLGIGQGGDPTQDGRDIKLSVMNDGANDIIRYRHNSGHRSFGPVDISQPIHAVFVVPEGAADTDDPYFIINGKKDTGTRSGGSAVALDVFPTGTVYIAESTTASVGVNDPFDGKLDQVALYDYALTDSQARRNYWRGQGQNGYALEVLANAPLAYWRLDEGSGTTAVDETGNGNEGTFSGSPTLGENGLVGDGASVDFDGSDDQLSTTLNPPTGGAARTVEMWLRWDGAQLSGNNKIHTLFSYGQSSAGQAFVVFPNDVSTQGTLGALRLSVNSGYITFNKPLHDGEVHHIALVVEGSSLPSQVRAFVDGVEDTVSSSGSQTINTASGTALDIAHGTVFSEDYWNGALDEPAVYGEALTPADIRRHYYAGLGGEFTGRFHRYAVGLDRVLHWRLSDADGEPAEDDSPLGNSGVYQGTIVQEVPGLVAGDDDSAAENVAKGDGYVEGPQLASTVVKAVTVMFTFGGNEGSDNDIVTLEPSGGSNWAFFINHRDSANTLRCGKNGGGEFLADTTISASADPHIVTVFYDAANDRTKMILDGVLQSNDAAGNLMDEANPVVILAAQRSGGTLLQRWKGKLDELIITRSGHTQAEWETLHAYALGL